MIRVLIADDHAIVRVGVRRIIDEQEDMKVVGEVADGAEVLDAVAATGCDVLVLDLSLPNRSGVELVEALTSTKGVQVNTIVLSMYPEDQMALTLLRQGALAYLTKEREPSELLEAIRRAARGQRYVTDTLTDMALASNDSGKLPHQQLSAREYQVFFLLIQGRTASEIADELELSVSTVSNHTASIKRKLGVESSGDVIRYASRIGLL